MIKKGGNNLSKEPNNNDPSNNSIYKHSDGE